MLDILIPYRNIILMMIFIFLVVIILSFIILPFIRCQNAPQLAYEDGKKHCELKGLKLKYIKPENGMCVWICG